MLEYRISKLRPQQPYIRDHSGPYSTGRPSRGHARSQSFHSLGHLNHQVQSVYSGARSSCNSKQSELSILSESTAYSRSPGHSRSSSSNDVLRSKSPKPQLPMHAIHPRQSALSINSTRSFQKPPTSPLAMTAPPPIPGPQRMSRWVSVPTAPMGTASTLMNSASTPTVSLIGARLSQLRALELILRGLPH